MPHSWNLSGWMHNLGLKRSDQPDLIHAVQPVEIVGDHSGFTSQILPPMAWMGGRVNSVAGTYGCLALTSAAAGGTYLRALSFTIGANNAFAWAVQSTVPAIANQVANMVVSDMGSQPTVSRLIMGTFAALPHSAIVAPRVYAGTNGLHFSDVAYIPPGFTFYLYSVILAKTVDAAVMFEDCPAQRSER